MLLSIFDGHHDKAPGAPKLVIDFDVLVRDNEASAEEAEALLRDLKLNGRAWLGGGAAGETTVMPYEGPAFGTTADHRQVPQGAPRAVQTIVERRQRKGKPEMILATVTEGWIAAGAACRYDPARWRVYSWQGGSTVGRYFKTEAEARAWLDQVS